MYQFCSPIIRWKEKFQIPVGTHENLSFLFIFNVEAINNKGQKNQFSVGIMN